MDAIHSKLDLSDPHMRDADPHRRENSAMRGLFATAGKRKLLASLILITATLLLYAPLKENRFINYDDPGYVTSNGFVQQGLNANNFVWAFKTTSSANWHPLTWIFYMIDCQLFGLNPAGYHLTSLVFHVINVVILFLLLHRATGAFWRSALVAALFALHPLNVESVAWVAELKNVLSTFFWFLAIWAYGWYTLNPNWRRYLSVVCSFALGLMAKPMLVTLPFTLFLLDFWPLRRVRFGAHPDTAASPSIIRLVLEKVPLLLLSAASSIITIIAQRSGGALITAHAFSFRSRISNALFAYADYLVKMLWPRNLSVFYPRPHTYPWWQLALAGLLLAAITTLVWRRRGRGYPLVCWCWYLGTLVPVIGLIQVGGQSMADRYVYVPSIGIFVLVVWGVTEWSVNRRALRYALIPVTIGALFVLSLRAHSQVLLWHDDLTLFTNILHNSPENAVAHNNLGTALADAGRLDEALPHFRAVEAIEPEDAEAHYNLGHFFLQTGNPREAIPEYGLCLYWTGSRQVAARARFDLGLAFSQTHQIDQAKANYRDAIKLAPDYSQAYINLGALLYSEKKADEALNVFAQALQIQQDPVAYLWIGRIQKDRKQNAEALKAYRTALKLSPGLVLAQREIDSIEQKEKP